jgi:hypothetical protein
MHVRQAWRAIMAARTRRRAGRMADINSRMTKEKPTEPGYYYAGNEVFLRSVTVYEFEGQLWVHANGLHQDDELLADVDTMWLREEEEVNSKEVATE